MPITFDAEPHAAPIDSHSAITAECRQDRGAKLAVRHVLHAVSAQPVFALYRYSLISCRTCHLVLLSMIRVDIGIASNLP